MASITAFILHEYTLHWKHSIGKFLLWCCAQRGIARVNIVCLSICDVEVFWSHRLEYFENSFMAD